MTARTTDHTTFTIERTFDAPPAQVFAAWEDVEARARWAVPAGDEIRFVDTDFRVGGRDVSMCGPAGNLSFRIETYYQDIVSNERLVITETVAGGDTLLSVSLITVEFLAADARTRLVLTDQMVALDGSDIADGSESGWAEVLGNLAAELRHASAADRRSARSH